MDNNTSFYCELNLNFTIGFACDNFKIRILYCGPYDNRVASSA